MFTDVLHSFPPTLFFQFGSCPRNIIALIPTLTLNPSPLPTLWGRPRGLPLFFVYVGVFKGSEAPTTRSSESLPVGRGDVKPSALAGD